MGWKNYNGIMPRPYHACKCYNISDINSFLHSILQQLQAKRQPPKKEYEDLSIFIKWNHSIIALLIC
jgi:hypothetical protein